KKIRVATEVANAIGLKNVTLQHLRGEEEKGRFDFVVSRAVMSLPDLIKIVRKNISKNCFNLLGNGVICLKGGSVEEEAKAYRKTAEIVPISDLFTEEWFQEKYIIHVPL
ncbi:MAG: class I SAM-dependent methyltransferase, partial [Bacteroidales bacterium]|nr:class I SAM-dependent methyltransferase [Bacteroidales bacterium]